MIFFIQFPILDTRFFSPEALPSLPVPTWPIPTPYREFVRDFGQVKARGRKGLQGWLGENEICDAKSALKFERLDACKLVRNSSVGFRCAARHFYHDGYASAKYELVLITKPRRLHFDAPNLERIVTHLTRLPVRIKNPTGTPIRVKLAKAGQPLADLFVYSTSYMSDHPRIETGRWAKAGSWTIFLEVGSQENLIPPNHATVESIPRHALELSHWWHRQKATSNIPTRVWMLRCNHSDKKSQDMARAIRLYIMRLNAEYESLRKALITIAQDETIVEDSNPNLQQYLNATTRKIGRNNAKVRESTETETVEELAKQTWDTIYPGHREAALERLRTLGARRQVLSKVEKRSLVVHVRDSQIGALGYNVEHKGNTNFDLV